MHNTQHKGFSSNSKTLIWQRAAAYELRPTQGTPPRVSPRISI